MNIFGDSDEGRLRLYQTADAVLLLLNNEMTDASGACLSSLHKSEGSQKEFRFVTFVASYCKILLLSFKIKKYFYILILLESNIKLKLVALFIVV